MGGGTAGGGGGIEWVSGASFHLVGRGTWATSRGRTGLAGGGGRAVRFCRKDKEMGISEGWHLEDSAVAPRG